MKRILLILMVASVILCVVGCNNGGTEDESTTTTTTTVGTTINTEVNNKIAKAKLDVDNIILCLSAYEEYGIALEVEADDTIGDIIKKFEADGSYIELFHIDENAKFFDYVMENPDYEPGADLYILKEDADWLSLYVD